MARKPEKPPRERRITIPEHGHPLAKLLYRLMREHNFSYDEVEFRSGVLTQTFKAWRTRTQPGLATIEATLGVFGWSVLPVPPRSSVPPQIQERLTALAEEWEGINPTLCQLMATVARAPIVQASHGPGRIIATIRPRRPRRGTVCPGQAVLFEEEAAA